MSSVQEDTQGASVKLVEGGKATERASKQRKKRRSVTRNGKLLNTKIDVQYSNNAKNYDVHHNGTFLPKASKNNNKKHQRNCLGECLFCCLFFRTIKSSESGQE